MELFILLCKIFKIFYILNNINKGWAGDILALLLLLYLRKSLGETFALNRIFLD